MPSSPTGADAAPSEDSAPAEAGRRRAGLFAAPALRRRKADLVAAGAIAACVVILASLVLATGSARTAHHESSAAPQPVYSPSTSTPESLRALWSQPSTRPGAPLVTTSNVITTSPNGITAWEAGIGDEQWSYSREGALCASQYFADEIVTVFTGRAGCSDSTAFRASDGEYDGGRQSAFADSVTMWADWSHVLVLGPDRLEVWRDDLVRTLEYGAVAAPQEKNQQPRSGCAFQSANLSADDVAVAETCPGDDADHVRVTVTAAVPEDSRVPEEESSVLTDYSQFHLIGLTASRESLGVAERDGRWMIVRLSSAGRSEILEDLPGEPALLPSPETVAHEPEQFRWFDGATTRAFDARTADEEWSLGGVEGPGHGLGAHTAPRDEQITPTQILVPVEGGVALAEASDGRITGTLPAGAPEGQEAPDASGAGAAGASEGAADARVVGLSQVGNILYVQRAGTLTAYEMTGSH